MDPENARAYLGKLLAQLRIQKQDDLKACTRSFEDNNNYQKALRFADKDLKNTLLGYAEAVRLAEQARQEERERREEQKRLAEREHLEEQERLAAQRYQEEEKRQQRKKKILAITAIVICVALALILLIEFVIVPRGQYNEAVALQESGKEAQAAIAFGKAGNYKDAREKSFALWDQIAQRETVSAGSDHTVGMKADGTAVAVGDNTYGECDVGGWTEQVLTIP